MKTIVILMIAVSAYTLSAQNVIDPPKIFSKDTINLIKENNEFILGWNWSSRGRQIDDALLIKYYHGERHHEKYDSTTDSIRLIYEVSAPKFERSKWLNAGRNANTIFNARALYFEPTLTVDTTQFFIPRAGDNTGAVFGFLSKNKVQMLSSDSINSSDYNRVILRRDSIIQPEVVLNNIWNGKILRWLDYDSVDHRAINPNWNYSIGRTNATLDQINEE